MGKNVGIVKKLFLAAGLVLSFSVVAEARTAVVNFTGAVFNSTKAQAIISAAQEEPEFVNLRTRGETLEADFQALREEFEKNELTWSEEQKAQANQRATAMRQEQEYISRTLSQYVQNTVMSELQTPAAEALDELVKDEKITILISADAVLMAAPETDLTEKLVQRINRKVQ